MQTIHKIIFSLAMVTLTHAQVWLRYNHAGYTPSSAKNMAIMADANQQGQTWAIYPSENPNGSAVLNGTVGASLYSANGAHPKAFNHNVDFSALSSVGTYVFRLQNGAEAQFKISQDPYSLFATQALRHLRVMRSGSSETLLHRASHLKDSAAIVAVPSGNPTLGAWADAVPRRTVDMQGGWYDAGDYIKFTLNEAYVVWNLLNAFEHNPRLFPKVYSQSQWPDILDEALHGLRYLAKTHPDSNTFIIQVGTGVDHQQGNRLPESDGLDGSRRALSAFSRVHLGATAAALALGARIFATRIPSEATTWSNLAQTLHARALRADAIRSAYEKDATNDFYYTTLDSGFVALASAELYALTNESAYLTQAVNWGPSNGGEISWATWNFFANATLGQWNAEAWSRAKSEAAIYSNRSTQNLWGYNSAFTWGTLHRWMGAANACGRVHQLEANVACLASVEKIRDVIFGRNPWGVSMIFSQDLDNTVKNIYSQIYPLLDEFPVGAISEGPGDRATHLTMRTWIPVPQNDPMEQFNTNDAVFYDNGKDFMIQEATIGGQADFVYLMALVSDQNFDAVADTGVGGAKPSLSTPDTVVNISATSMVWYAYDDRSEGGASIAATVVKSADSVYSDWQVNSSAALDYQYAGMNGVLGVGKAQNMDGVTLTMNIPQGVSVKVQLEQSDITDYDHYSKTLVGNGLAEYRIDFSQLSQGGFGVAKPFDPAKVIRLGLLCESSGTNMRMVIKNVQFYGYDSVTTLSQHGLQKSKLMQGQPKLMVIGNQLKLRWERWVQGVRQFYWTDLRGRRN